jgi:hypothetical protein
MGIRGLGGCLIQKVKKLRQNLGLGRGTKGLFEPDFERWIIAFFDGYLNLGTKNFFGMTVFERIVNR